MYKPAIVLFLYLISAYAQILSITREPITITLDEKHHLQQCTSNITGGNNNISADVSKEPKRVIHGSLVRMHANSSIFINSKVLSEHAASWFATNSPGPGQGPFNGLFSLECGPHKNITVSEASPRIAYLDIPPMFGLNPTLNPLGDSVFRSETAPIPTILNDTISFTLFEELLIYEKLVWKLDVNVSECNIVFSDSLKGVGDVKYPTTPLPSTYTRTCNFMKYADALQYVLPQLQNTDNFLDYIFAIPDIANCIIAMSPFFGSTYKDIIYHDDQCHFQPFSFNVTCNSTFDNCIVYNRDYLQDPCCMPCDGFTNINCCKPKNITVREEVDEIMVGAVNSTCAKPKESLFYFNYLNSEEFSGSVDDTRASFTNQLVEKESQKMVSTVRMAVEMCKDMAPNATQMVRCIVQKSPPILEAIIQGYSLQDSSLQLFNNSLLSTLYEQVVSFGCVGPHQPQGQNESSCINEVGCNWKHSKDDCGEGDICFFGSTLEPGFPVFPLNNGTNSTVECPKIQKCFSPNPDHKNTFSDPIVQGNTTSCNGTATCSHFCQFEKCMLKPEYSGFSCVYYNLTLGVNETFESVCRSRNHTYSNSKCYDTNTTNCDSGLNFFKPSESTCLSYNSTTCANSVENHCHFQNMKCTQQECENHGQCSEGNECVVIESRTTVVTRELCNSINAQLDFFGCVVPMQEQDCKNKNYTWIPHPDNSTVCTSWMSCNLRTNSNDQAYGPSGQCSCGKLETAEWKRNQWVQTPELRHAKVGQKLQGNLNKWVPSVSLGSRFFHDFLPSNFTTYLHKNFPDIFGKMQYEAVFAMATTTCNCNTANVTVCENTLKNLKTSVAPDGFLAAAGFIYSLPTEISGRTVELRFWDNSGSGFARANATKPNLVMVTTVDIPWSLPNVSYSAGDRVALIQNPSVNNSEDGVVISRGYTVHPDTFTLSQGRAYQICFRKSSKDPNGDPQFGVMDVATFESGNFKPLYVRCRDKCCNVTTFQKPLFLIARKGCDANQVYCPLLKKCLENGAQCRLPAPQVQHTRVLPSGEAAVVTFDIATNRGGINATGDFACALLFANFTGTCKWESNSRLKFMLHNNTPLGTQYHLLGNKIAGANTFFLDPTILVLEAPLQSDINAVISAPSTLSYCSGLTLSARLSPGAATRTLNINWKFEPAINGTSHSTNETLSFSASDIPLGTYNITLTVSNWLGFNATRTKQITKFGQSPEVFINNPNPLQVFRFSAFNLDSRANFPNCNQNNISGSITFLWTSSPAVNGLSFSERRLPIPANTLVANTAYTFTVKASLASNANLFGTASITVNVGRAGVIAKFAHPSRSVGASEAVVVDGSASSDQDNLPGSLGYSWTCIYARNQTVTPTACPMVLTNVATLTFPAGNLTAGIYKFTLNVSKGDLWDTEDTVVYVQPGAPPKVFITSSSASGLVSPNGFAFLVGRVSNTTVSIRWTAMEVLANQTEIDHSVASQENLRTLVVQGDSLTAGSRYKFRLTATDAQQQQGFAEASLTVNSAPRDGGFVVEPQTGVALNQTFTLSTFGWIDEETHKPLVYRYGVLKGNEVSFLSGRTEASSIGTQFFAGAYTLFVEATDRFGAVSNRVFFNITVTANQLSKTALEQYVRNTLESDIKTAKELKDSDEVLNKVRLAANALALVDLGNQTSGFQRDLVQTLKDITTNKTTGDVLQQKAGLLSLITGNSSVTREVAKESLDLMSNWIGKLDLQEGEKVPNDVLNYATNIFDSSLQTIAKDTSNIQENKNLVENIFDTLSKLAEARLNASPCNGDPSISSSGDLQVTEVKQTGEKLSASPLDTGDSQVNFGSNFTNAIAGLDDDKCVKMSFVSMPYDVTNSNPNITSVVISIGVVGGSFSSSSEYVNVTLDLTSGLDITALQFNCTFRASPTSPWVTDDTCTVVAVANGKVTIRTKHFTEFGIVSSLKGLEQNPTSTRTNGEEVEESSSGSSSRTVAIVIGVVIGGVVVIAIVIAIVVLARKKNRVTPH